MTDKTGISEIDIRRGHEEIQRLQSIVKEPIFLAGGFMRWACSPCDDPVEYGDIDIFTTNSTFEGVRTALRRHKDIIYDRTSEVAISYWDCENRKTYQVIRPRTELNIEPAPDEGLLAYLLAVFDFTIVRCGMELHAERAYHAPFFKIDEKGHNLSVVNLTNPVNSLVRAFKYVKRGYTIAPTEIGKIMSAAWALDETSRQKALCILQVMEGVDDPTENGWY